MLGHRPLGDGPIVSGTGEISRRLIGTGLLSRRIIPMLAARLNHFPAVALLGPRQVGKSTLARAISETTPSLFLDLERPADRVLLSDAELYLSSHQDKLVILDEVHRVPELFQTLRVLIDQGRRAGRRAAQFLLLGSASGELLRQSSESLAGRVSYMELGPLDVLEVDGDSREALWVRGGFPDSFLAQDEQASFRWREDLVRTYLERDIPYFAPRLPSETLRRFWTMLAYSQGALFNASRLAEGLAVEGRSVGRYLDLLVDLLLARRLEPHFVNVGKRLVKSPKVYIRDSGIVHALLNLVTLDQLLSNPVVGASWEGFAIENLIAADSPGARPSFYRTQAGAEIDLILERPGGRLWVMEIKRSLVPTPTRGFYNAIEDLRPERAFVVYAGTERFPLKEGIEAIGLRELASELAMARI